MRADPVPSDETAPRVAPVSFAQARLWLLDRLFPGESVYNELLVLRFAGAVDRGVLERALNEVIRRHGSLRTRFAVVDGEPAQVVAPSLRIALEGDDLRGLPAHERVAAARERARADGRAPFDLEQGPLVRARLITLADDEHWFAITLHHIVTDGWSSTILQGELLVLYAVFHGGGPSPFPELAIQYADHALRQRDALRGDALAASVAYWKRALDGVAPLELPADRPRPAVADHAGGRIAFAVDAELARRLKALSRSRRATLFMTLLAAFEVLVHRYAGQDDFAVGVPVAARTRPEVEPLIGFFVNMAVMRADVAGAPRFDELVDRVRARTLEAFEHQELPFERVVMELAPPRDTSRNPIFQVSFALHPATAAPSWQVPGASVSLVGDLVHESSKFDLSFTVNDRGDTLAGTIDYATSLFDAATVERMARAYVSLLRSIVAHPEERIGRLAMQDAGERERRLAASRGRKIARPAKVRVERLVEARAREHPDAVAVADARAPLSYRELDARANRLARAIVDVLPATPRRVALFLERGGDLVVAMLATLKAGAAYVPVDPDYPAERVRAMLDDASAGLVVADERLATRLPAGGPDVLCVDRDATRIASFPATPPDVAPDADDVAYVMYTSGSTGRPKGVAVTHGAIANLVRDTDYVTLGADDVMAYLANPAFDAATFEVWGALANGARLAPIAKATVLEPRALAAALAAQGVTTLFLTTALFNAVVRDTPAAFARCRQVLVGGEAVESRWVREALRAGAPARLLNGYGPTETTTFATWHDIRAEDAARDTIPIGRAIANAEVYVLDPEGEPVPVGVPGEIYIGGAGVARGYLGNEALTAERFVRHPFADDASARLFRTGDRARVREDGAIEFLGRADRQVKVRGHRIELGEIEGALARLPYVREAVVQLRGATADTRRVVAWLVPADPGSPPPTTLRRDLRRLLPEAMLPGATVWVPSLPLNANGKIDVRALPEPGDAPRRGVATPPRDMFEGVLVRLWEDVLGIRGIGVHDHFFEIGGHSLLAARLLDTIARETGMTVPLTALFADDTIDGLARALREGAPGANAPIVVVNEAGARPPFVFMHGDFQAGGFYSRALALALGPDQPVLIVHPHGLVGDAIPESIEAMAAERIGAVRAIRPTGPYVVGGHCNGALVAFEMARQLVAAGESVPAVVLMESRAPSPGPKPQDDVGAYVKFNSAGEPTVLAPRDRVSEVELVYTRAIDAYAAGPFDGHVVVIQAEQWRAPTPDAGWARHARTWEGHMISGDHVTLITRHLDDLARTLRDAIGRATALPRA